MRKQAFDFEQTRQFLGRPEIMGPLLASMPHLTHPLTRLTGGMGLMGLTDLARTGGANISSFFKGPLAGRQPRFAAKPQPAPTAPVAPWRPGQS